MTASAGKSIVILGATGLLGRLTTETALKDPAVSRITALSRRPMPEFDGSPKFTRVNADYENLDPNADFWKSADAVICCLGTTIKTAGSREKFYRVDHDYPMKAAEIAKKNGVRAFVLVSSKGAGIHSSVYYCRVKGETERDIAALHFESLALVRPNVIAGKRKEFRAGESFMLLLLKTFGPILPLSSQVSPADTIVKTLLACAKTPKAGTKIIESDQILKGA